MRTVAYTMVLGLIIACDSGKDTHSSDMVTLTVGNDDTPKAIRSSSQGSLPAEHEKFTFSTYAEVTPADKVEVVLLVDTELEAEQKENLAEGIDSLLEHIINSNWNIAVAELDTTTYPTKFISKYANYADYAKQFAAALDAGEKPTATGQAAPPAGQGVTLRAFIIITGKSFADTKLADNKVILAEGEHAPLTKVYAILNTANDLSGYLNWQNEQDKNVLSRYSSLQANYKKVLEEFSADIANTLRGIFVIPPLPLASLKTQIEAAGGQAAGGDDSIAQLKVFNAPEGVEAQTGFIHNSHYQVKRNTVITRAKFSEGTCVDVTLAK